MAIFKFRAQAALDLRQRQLDAARRELADAERVRDHAQARYNHADRLLLSARRAGSERARQSGTITDWHWYRFWILRLEHERAAESDALKAREAAVEASRLVCVRAQQRCESLERFRAKARKAFEAAEAAAERKRLDELATRRFVLNARKLQGVTS